LILQGTPILQPPTNWYDNGFFYFDEGYGHLVNPLAEKAIFKIWAQFEDREVIGKSAKSGSEMGAIFEREVIKGLARVPILNIQPFFLHFKAKTDNPPVPSQLSLSGIEKIVPFVKIDQIPQPPAIECRLLKPSSQNFKYWDCIIEDGHSKQLVLIQISTQYPTDAKKKKKIANSFVQSDTGENFIEQIINGVFKEKVTKAIVKDGSLVVSLSGVASEWKVKFLFVTSQKENDIKSEVWEFQGVLVVGRESLLKLGLQFS